MPKPDSVPFIFSETIQHPPWFSISCRFDQDAEKTIAQYVLTCEPESAQETYTDAVACAKYSKGSITALDTRRKKPTFTISLPILPGAHQARLISPSGTFVMGGAEKLAWTLARFRHIFRTTDKPFIYTIAIEYAGCFKLAGQYDVSDMEIQHLFTVQPEYADFLHDRARLLQGSLGGTISFIDRSESKPTFSVTTPIRWKMEDLNSPSSLPSALFLIQNQAVFQFLAGTLHQQRLYEFLRKKYGPKDD